MEKNNRNILEVKNLVTEFATEDGTVKAVDNISFDLKPGETIGIVGESGSGKSVTSLSIMRLIPSPPGKISGGQIMYDDGDKKVDLLQLPENEMRRIRGNDIAMIFQEPMTSLNPVYTCGEQVAEAILQHYDYSDPATVGKVRRIFRWVMLGLGVLGMVFTLLCSLHLFGVNIPGLPKPGWMGIAVMGVSLLVATLLVYLKYNPNYIPKKHRLDVPYLKHVWQVFMKRALVFTLSIGSIGAYWIPLPFLWCFLISAVFFASAIVVYKYVHTSRWHKAKVITKQLFEDTKLPNPERIFSAYPHQLSGGQKQRVMIAMAMSCNPSILVADEPTTALDVTVQKTILELMKSLQAKYHVGIIFITHDLGVVAELADKVLVMYKGKIVEEGEVKELFANPKHPYTKGLLACRPRLDIRLKKLPVVNDFMVNDANENIIESGYRVTDLVSKYKISTNERETQLRQLFARKPVLQVRNLCKWYPQGKNVLGKTTHWLKAVDDVSFDVYEGETLGLVGESGCGKTTLGRAIIRLIEPTSGQVFYDGKDLSKISTSQMRSLRKDLQIIFQDPYSSLNPRMTIGESIMEPMRVHGILKSENDRKNHVIELLERVNMKPGHFGRYPHEFSGGQRQRICIARSIALHPRFIICDESVSALDVSVQAQVLNLLNELKRDFNFTYIFISHDLSVVKFMSDRMLVMNAGKIEEMDIAEKIYDNPQKPYTRKLIEAIPKGL